MNLRTITISAADVAAALEFIMPFGHGNRIPEQYIINKTREMSRNQRKARNESKRPTKVAAIQKRETVVSEETHNQVLVEKTLADKDESTTSAETASIDEIEPANGLRGKAVTQENKQDEEKPATEENTQDEEIQETDNIEAINSDGEGTVSIVDCEGDKPLMATEEISSIEASTDADHVMTAEPAASSDHVVGEEEKSHVSADDEDDVSLDFTISVSISDDEDQDSIEESGTSSLLFEERTSVEVIADNANVEVELIAPSVTDGVSNTTKSNESSDEEITAADQDGDLEVITERNEIEEEQAKQESLIVNGLMSNWEKFYSDEAGPETIDMAASNDVEEEYYQSITSRDSFLIKLSLLGGLDDVIYDEFVEQICENKALVMSIIRRYDVGLLREIEKPVQLTSYKHSDNETAESQTESRFAGLQERKKVLNLEPLELPDFSYVEDVMRATQAQVTEILGTSVEEPREEVVNEIATEYESVDSNPQQLRDDDIEIREDVESMEEREEFTTTIETDTADMPKPKFRAIIETVDENDDEDSTRDQSTMSRNIPLEARNDLPESNETRVPANELTTTDASTRSVEHEVTSRRQKRQPFAPTTTMATIRAEVEAKYSNMPRPTAAFDRETLYAKSNSATISHSRLFPVASRKVGVTSAYKAPVVRVASAHIDSRRQPIRHEIINLEDYPEPMMVSE